jgi:putative hemolysin
MKGASAKPNARGRNITEAIPEKETSKTIGTADIMSQLCIPKGYDKILTARTSAGDLTGKELLWL